MRRRGFTIVELLVVIGIIAILMGIITTAVSSSIKSARVQKANSLCQLMQTALATYYEQKGDWPITMPVSRANKAGVDGNNDADLVELNGSEVRECVRKLIEETKKNNPMMDISGLYVSRSDGELRGGIRQAFGLDFMQAIRGTRKSQRKMKTSEMYFGYPEEESGFFRHFKMVYSIPADTITVSKMDTDKEKAEFYE